MNHTAAELRGEEKFQTILRQIASIRTRLNALALQKGLFGALTFALVAAILVVGAAFAFGPLGFLVLGIVAVLAAVAAIARVASAAWRMRVDDARAARVGDERAGLKGRLTTMVDASRAGRRSILWPYLVEDTAALRDEFLAAKVEPRRASNWLWAALVSCIAAALVMHLAYRARTFRMRVNSIVANAPGEASADIGDLDIRPADPSSNPGTEIDADPATLRKLAEKLREAQRSGQPNSSTSRLMASARDAASALQNKLTGGKPSEPAQRLKLTDKNEGSSGKDAAQAKQGKASPPANGSQNDSQASGSGEPSSDHSQPSSAPSPGTPDMSSFAALNGLNSDNPAPTSPDSQSTPQAQHKVPRGGPLGTGGADHGSGSDPQHLYGQPEAQPLGNDTFKIPVEVGPSDQGASNTAQAPPPQHAKSALNSSQAPDEPFERASIPASDRVMIKRVFER
jgi:hypothetical protein